MPGNSTKSTSKINWYFNKISLYKVALICDINQAFLNLSGKESDRDFLQFWCVKNISSDKIEIIVRRFARVRVAFGTTASQFLLVVSIHKHFLTNENVGQNFVEKFLANLYVDDNINGDDSYETTFELYKKGVACMKDAGFKLRKFHTNDPNLQTTINKTEKFQLLEDNLKVLGIDWQKKNYEAGIELPTTKRNVLKIIASIYDPIGIILPVVVLFKILYQKISLLKCEWDSDLNPRLASE